MVLARYSLSSAHAVTPTSPVNFSCAFRQYGNALSNAFLPRGVSLTNFPRLPESRVSTKPARSSGRILRDSVEGESTSCRARRAILSSCSTPSVTKTTTCVDRNPVGCKMSSYSWVTTRDALRRLKLPHSRKTSRHASTVKLALGWFGMHSKIGAIRSLLIIHMLLDVYNHCIYITV